MKDFITTFDVFDSNFLNAPEISVCHEICETFTEAKLRVHQFGDSVIVKNLCQLKAISKEGRPIYKPVYYEIVE